MTTCFDDGIITSLDELTYDELDELGKQVTEAIAHAQADGRDDLVDQLLVKKDRINKIKAVCLT